MRWHRLDQGPWLTVDGVFINEMAYQNCASGCVATTTLAPFLTSSMTGGTQAIVTIVALDGRRIGVPITLDGLASGIGALTAK